MLGENGDFGPSYPTPASILDTRRKRIRSHLGSVQKQLNSVNYTLKYTCALIRQMRRELRIHEDAERRLEILNEIEALSRSVQDFMDRGEALQKRACDTVGKIRNL